jgi:hypothetical protein
MDEIEIVIETLVLDGFEPADGQRFGTAFREEFTGLLREMGLPSSWNTNAGSNVLIRVPTLDIESNSDPQSMGVQVARALYEGGES